MIRLPGKARGHWDGAGIRGFGCKSSFFFVCGGGIKKGRVAAAAFPPKRPNDRGRFPENNRTTEQSRLFGRKHMCAPETLERSNARERLAGNIPPPVRPKRPNDRTTAVVSPPPPQKRGGSAPPRPERVGAGVRRGGQARGWRRLRQSCQLLTVFCQST